MRRMCASLAILVAAALFAACGDGTAPTANAVSEAPDLPASEPSDDADLGDGTDGSVEPEAAAAAPPVEDIQAVDDPEPPPTTGAGTGTARVEVGEESFDFQVIQCLRDVPGLLGGIVAFQLDGVPIDTPPELAQPLLGVADPDADIVGLLRPVLEHGPILSVTRLDGGGDDVAVSLGEGEAYVSDGATSGDRYLDIGDEPEGAAVTREATVTVAPDASAALSLRATCP